MNSQRCRGVGALWGSLVVIVFIGAAAIGQQTRPVEKGPKASENPDLTYDSFIHYTSPVYPGAQGDKP